MRRVQVSCFAADGTMLLLDMNAKAPPKAKKPAKVRTAPQSPIQPSA